MLAFFVGSPQPALGANDRLACQLTQHPHLLKSAFELPHVGFKSFAYSPTGAGAAAPYGADVSWCEALLWRHFPEWAKSKGNHFPGGPPHYSMPACCGILKVETTVQDDGPEGAEYDPNLEASLANRAAEELISRWKGGVFPVPHYGASDSLGYWFGSKRHIAHAYWQVNDSIIEIEVGAHKNPQKKLREVAISIVPAFMAYG